MYIEFFDTFIAADGKSVIPILAMDILEPMTLREVELINSGWKIYDPCFSSLLERKECGFIRIGSKTYYKRKG